MKRALSILAAGAVLCVAVCMGCYYFLTAPQRAMMDSPSPELAWLGREFQLGEAELAEITRLHQAYLPKCGEMCAQIAGHHHRIGQLLEEHRALTPEVERLLREAADLRLGCQKMMLQHFIDVSRAMPPAQGSRYLAWVQSKTWVMPHEYGHGSVEGTSGHHGH